MGSGQQRYAMPPLQPKKEDEWVVKKTTGTDFSS